MIDEQILEKLIFFQVNNIYLQELLLVVGQELMSWRVWNKNCILEAVALIRLPFQQSAYQSSLFYRTPISEFLDEWRILLPLVGIKYLFICLKD